MAIRKIMIEVQERTSHDGRKFPTFKGLMNNNKYIDVKFRQCVKPLPTEKCFIYVTDDNMNVNTAGRYPVLWVSAIEAIEDYEYSNQKSREFVANNFDEAEELPD